MSANEDKALFMRKKLIRWPGIWVDVYYKSDGINVHLVARIFVT